MSNLAHDIELVQSTVKSSITETTIIPKVDNSFSKLSTLDKEIIKTIFGSEAGDGFYDFVKSVDKDHPLAHEMLDAEYDLVLDDLIHAANFSKGFVLENLHKLTPKELKQKISKLADPRKNQQNIRFLKSLRQIHIARATKKSRVIDTQATFNRGINHWDNLQDSFYPYARTNLQIGLDIEKAKERALKYKNLGCIELSNEIMKNIDSLDEYVGFYKIRMTTALLMVAKLAGFQAINQFDKYSIDISCDKLYQFDLSKGRSTYRFRPTAYPLHEFKAKIPDGLSSLIEFLDCCPLINGRALFDHLIVVMPGIEYPSIHYKGSKFGFYDLQGNSHFYKDRETANRKLDFYLAENNILTPVLLGEKNGSCYFISYWCKL